MYPSEPAQTGTPGTGIPTIVTGVIHSLVLRW